MGKEWQILECLKEICNKVFAFWVMLLHLFFTAWDFEVFGNLFQFVFVGEFAFDYAFGKERYSNIILAH